MRRTSSTTEIGILLIDNMLHLLLELPLRLSAARLSWLLRGAVECGAEGPRTRCLASLAVARSAIPDCHYPTRSKSVNSGKSLRGLVFRADQRQILVASGASVDASGSCAISEIHVSTARKAISRPTSSACPYASCLRQARPLNPRSRTGVRRPLRRDSKVRFG